MNSSIALGALLGSIPIGGNNWEAAGKAVDEADDETVRAALKRLLTLHLHDLQTQHPQVAMRNVQLDDVILSDGVPLTVSDTATRGIDDDTVYLTLYPASPNRTATTKRMIANDRDVKVPLISRPLA